MTLNRPGLTVVVTAALFAFTGAAIAHGHDKDNHHHNGKQDHEHEATEESAGHSHDKASMHGGGVTMSEQFHIESVFLPNEIHLFVYDGRQNPLLIQRGKKARITGSVTIEFHDRSRKPMTFVLNRAVPDRAAEAGEEHAHHEEAEHQHEHGHGEHAEPHEEHEHTHAEDAHDAGHGDHEHAEDHHEHKDVNAVVWVCPMDPDQFGDKGIECPKCGMKFVLQDYLTAKVNLADIKPGSAKAVFILKNLPSKDESQTTFTRKIALTTAGHHDEHDEQAERDEYGKHGKHDQKGHKH